MHSATVHDLSNVAHICDESQILHAAAGILRKEIIDITISDDEYPAPEKFSISNYGAKLHSSWKYSCVGCWMILSSSQQTIALLFQQENFENVYLQRKTCGYTWGLYLVVVMVGDISQFTICVARFLISHVRFYPPLTLLQDATLPLLFSELGKNIFTKS